MTRILVLERRRPHIKADEAGVPPSAIDRRG
jgi:hypothetical protein